MLACVPIFSSYEDVSQIGSGSSLITLFPLSGPCLLVTSHSGVLGLKDSSVSFPEESGFSCDTLSLKDLHLDQSSPVLHPAHSGN